MSIHNLSRKEFARRAGMSVSKLNKMYLRGELAAQIFGWTRSLMHGLFAPSIIRWNRPLCRMTCKPK